ncbi:MAG: nitrilase-related carbon-nitrogen hydrolase, partial [Woeseiaceae bacterium]
MSNKVTLAIAQLDMVVGAVAANTQKILDYSVTARDEMRADIVAFPELGICGYAAEDLLLHSGMRSAVAESIKKI